MELAVINDLYDIIDAVNTRNYESKDGNSSKDYIKSDIAAVDLRQFTTNLRSVVPLNPNMFTSTGNEIESNSMIDIEQVKDSVLEDTNIKHKDLTHTITNAINLIQEHRNIILIIWLFLFFVIVTLYKLSQKRTDNHR